MQHEFNKTIFLCVIGDLLVYGEDLLCENAAVTSFDIFGMFSEPFFRTGVRARGFIVRHHLVLSDQFVVRNGENSIGRSEILVIN